MAFFQNTKPNAIVGISLPTDGSDVVTLHLVKQGLDGKAKESYDQDKHFFEGIVGAKVFHTSGGCMITFEQGRVISRMFESARDFFDPSLVEAVEERRKIAWEETLRIRINKGMIIEKAQEVVDTFKDKPAANTSRMTSSCVVNIRTHLSTLN